MPGYKNFLDTQIVTSDNFMDFIMKQAVIVCDSELERDIGLPSYLREGMVTYTKDTGYFSVYDGSTWNRMATVSEAAAGYNPRDNEVILGMNPVEVVLFI